MEATENPKSEL